MSFVNVTSFLLALFPVRTSPYRLAPHCPTHGNARADSRGKTATLCAILQ